MNDLQIFNNPEFGEIRAIEVDGEAYFVGRDVASALGYAKPTNAVVRHVDGDDTLKRGISDGSGKSQQTLVINESGVYALIIMSQIPSAKKFKKWVTKEVLPSIRKTGSYNSPQPISPNELILQMAQANVELEKKVIAIEQKLDTALQVFSKPNIDHWKDDIDCTICTMVDTYGLSPLAFRGKLYRELEIVDNVKIGIRLNKLKDRLKNQGLTYKERMALTKLDVISKDKHLKVVFEGIVKKYQATFSMQN